MNPATMQQSMLDLILDRILTRPVDWLSAQDQIFSDPAMAKDDGSLIREILNFGPGYGVLKSEAQRRPNIQVLDVSVAKIPSIPTSEASAGDIAIVGMSVDLPGAPDTASLWKVLRDEINMVTEVRRSEPNPRASPTDPCRYLNLVFTLMTSKSPPKTRLIIPEGP